MSGGKNVLPKSRSLRVEVYLPVRFDSSYERTREWLVEEFTAFFGGCTVIEHVQGWYRAKDFSTVEDTITIIYSDTPQLHAKEGRVLRTYLDGLKGFIEFHLSEESIFIAFWPVEHAEGT
jgi:hypothetical protein